MNKKFSVMAVIVMGCASIVFGYIFIKKPASLDSGISGIAMLGPTCPVMRIPPDPQCKDRPYIGELAVIAESTSQIVATFTTKDDGSFLVNVEPGTYTIRNTGNAMLPRCLSSGPTTVTAHTYTQTDISCDTGIR